ncbi:MAG: peptidylprolyl isomerase [Candidatus Auribacterota bacterium]|jgi:FKBP-type peptidyl-prolyl cis-trans isomerase 2|nr:peptidylprolyl isomerase [Candidatus Auribacterota bacterium]
MIRNILLLSVTTIAFTCLTLNCNAQEQTQGDSDMVHNGDSVKVDYKLTVDDEVIDSSEGREPLEVTLGQGQLIPGFEKELIGMHKGEKKSFTLTPDDGYGQVNNEAFAEIPRDKLDPSLNPEVGMILSVGSPDGTTHRAKIHEVTEENIVLDFNHPLAGKTLNFDVEIVEIEEAE